MQSDIKEEQKFQTIACYFSWQSDGTLILIKM